MEHLTETDLNEYLDGLMEPAAQARLQGHLSDCADCRARLAGLQTVFQALAALPELTPERNLSSSVLKKLPRNGFGLGWQLAFAIQAGFSLGVLLLFSPLITGRIAGILPSWKRWLALPEIKFPNPVNFHFGPPVIPMPHLPSLTLPVTITQANFSIWLILGIAAVLLFALGNFSLIFHDASRAGK